MANQMVIRQTYDLPLQLSVMCYTIIQDKSRPGTLVGLGVPLEIFASDNGHKKRHVQKEKDDKQVRVSHVKHFQKNI